MRIKLGALFRNYLVFLILLNMGLFKVLGDYAWVFGTTHRIHIITAVSSVVLCLICISNRRIYCRIQSYCGFINKFCALSVLVVGVEIVYTLLRYDASVKYTFHQTCCYFYVMLAYPLLYVIVTEKDAIFRLMRLLLFSTVISLAIRTVIALIYDFTGKKYFIEIMQEYAAINWTRNGNIRINPPCSILIIVPVCIFLIYHYPNKIITKAVAKICMLFLFFYSIFIHQTRSFPIYLIIGGLVMILLKKRAPRKHFLVIGFVSLCAGILLNTEYLYLFLKSFIDKGNSSLYASTALRISAVTYFSRLFTESPVFGIGVLSSLDPGAVSLLRGIYGKYYLEDIGILGGIFRFGIIGLLLYVFLIIWMIVTIMKCASLKRYNNDYYLLLVGMFAELMSFGVSIDWFFGLVAFSMPFVLAFGEYGIAQVYNIDLERNIIE